MPVAAAIGALQYQDGSVESCLHATNAVSPDVISFTHMDLHVILHLLGLIAHASKICSSTAEDKISCVTTAMSRHKGAGTMHSRRMSHCMAWVEHQLLEGCQRPGHMTARILIAQQ